MLLTWDTRGTGWLVTEDGFAGLGSPEIYQLFYRLINSEQSRSPFVNAKKPETFLPAEIQIMNGQLTLLARANAMGQTIDPVQLAAALSEALGKPVSALLPQSALDKIDAIEAGVEGVELTAEDLAPDEPLSPDELAEAFEIAVPRVSEALRRQRDAGGGLPG